MIDKNLKQLYCAFTPENSFLSLIKHLSYFIFRFPWNGLFFIKLSDAFTASFCFFSSSDVRSFMIDPAYCTTVQIQIFNDSYRKLDSWYNILVFLNTYQLHRHLSKIFRNHRFLPPYWKLVAIATTARNWLLILCDERSFSFLSHFYKNFLSVVSSSR